MEFRLDQGEERDFRDLFKPPFSWSHVRRDEEMRHWRVLTEEPKLVRLMHKSGAVALLTCDGDRATSVDLVQGPEAEPIVRRHAFQADAALKARFSQAFAPGRPATEAARLLGSGTTALETGPNRATWRTAEGPVIEAELDGDRVRTARLLTGGDALDRIREAAVERRWSVPAFPGGPLNARNSHEVTLFLDVMQATRLDSRVVGPELQVLVPRPERFDPKDLRTNASSDLPFR